MSLKKITRDPESIIALCFMVISLLYFIGGQNPLLKRSLTGRYGSAFYPNIFASLLLILSIILLIGRYKKCSKTNYQEQKNSKTSRKLLLLFCFIILCPIIMNYCGFIFMGLLSIFIFSKILSLSTKEAVFLSLGLTGSVYILFNTFLKVQLPKGIFF